MERFQRVIRYWDLDKLTETIRYFEARKDNQYLIRPYEVLEVLRAEKRRRKKPGVGQ